MSGDDDNQDEPGRPFWLYGLRIDAWSFYGIVMIYVYLFTILWIPIIVINDYYNCNKHCNFYGFVSVDDMEIWWFHGDLMETYNPQIWFGPENGVTFCKSAVAIESGLTSQ